MILKRIRFGAFLLAWLLFTGAMPAQAQDHPISGTVTDVETGATLPGVNVVVKGTTIGAATAMDGTYELVAPNAQDTLIFSFIGYEAAEVAIDGRSVVDVALAPDVSALDEVVVVGYGTQRRTDVTSAISSVSGAELTRQLSTSVAQALQGKVAGVNVTQNSGTPGGGLSIDIRGIGTLGNSSPLVVVDGIPGGNLSAISPDDIASIEILKDAAATAIYGANGANGVVLVTTKAGGGETRVDFDVTYGIQQLGNKIDVLNAQQWATLQNEARRNSGLPEYWENPASLGEGTDWQDALTRTALMQKYNMSVAGGSDGLSYFISGDYLDQQGVMIGSAYDRISLRVNADYTVSDLFTIGNRLAVARTNRSTIPTDYPFATDNRLVGALEMSPVVPVRRDGHFAGPRNDEEGSSQGPNPVGLATINDISNQGVSLIERGFIEIEPIDNLQIRTEVGAEFSYSEYREFHPTYRWGITSSSLATLYRGTSNFFSWISQTTATYSLAVADDHHLEVLGGFSFSEGRYESISATGRGFASEEVTTISGADEVVGTGEFIDETSSVGYFGRLNYDYQHKYLFTANLRVDGSSKFGAENRFGTFPSFSVGWRVSEEPFMESVDFIDELKLRASWGQAGNSRIGNYNYLSRLNLSQYYVLGESQDIVTGVAPVSFANTEVKWETTTQIDVGVDMGLFDSRVRVTADYYRKRTSDILLPIPLPSSSGIIEAPYQNAGEVLNWGLEMAVNYRESIGVFRYDLGANVSTINNEVLDLGGGLPVGSPILYRESARLTRTAEGHPIGSFYGFVTDGLFQNQQEVEAHAEQPGAQPGDIRFKDINDDGVITGEDRTFIGSPIPDLTYGFSANIGYRNFDLYVSLQGVYGNKLMNTVGYRLLNGSHIGNKMAGILDRWTGPGTSNDMPRVTWNDPNNNARISDRYVEDGSYLRVQNVKLAYNLPSSLKNKVGARELRIYVSAQNLLTLTGYSGFDPEIGKVDNNNLNYGIDMGNYPVPRMFTVGVSLGF